MTTVNRLNKQIHYTEGTVPKYVDPLAQTFLIEEPSVVTKLDLYFRATDPIIPTKIEIRKVKDGFPTSIVVPFSETTIPAANINGSSVGSIATTVTFSSPVYLEPEEYALVLYCDSINTKVWISQQGETDVVTGEKITKQPYLGVLFKSQNGTTWTPDQFQDLKFRLYRARFLSTTATVHLYPGELSGKLTTLPYDPFEFTPGSKEMKVYHENHGFKNGSYTLTSPLRVTGFGNTHIYGVAHNVISGQSLVVSNVSNDSYTVYLPHAPNVTAVTRVGESVIGFSDTKYDTIYPAVTVLNPAGTSVAEKIKTTSTDYVMDSDYTTLGEGDYTFITERTLPSGVNRARNMSNATGLLYRVEMSTTEKNVAPILDLQKAGVVLIRNIINNPTYDNMNLAKDKVTVGFGNTISFTSVSNNTGTINLTNSNHRANAVNMLKGSTIRILGANVNSGNVRVLDVQNNGANVLVRGVTTQSSNIITMNYFSNASANIVIENGRNFIAEEAAIGGSALSKYITRQVNFINPSTSFKFFIDVCQPSGAYVKFYYRTSLVGETSPLTDKEYTEITGVTIPTSLSGEFYEVEKILENLEQFDGIQFKIVFLADDSTDVPKCKNLRLVALA